MLPKLTPSPKPTPSSEVNMLPKYKYPMLNRKQRRHPAAMARDVAKGWAGGGNFLLAGLLMRGGYNYQPPLSRDDPNYGAVV